MGSGHQKKPKNSLPDEDKLGELADLLFSLPTDAIDTSDLEEESEDG